MLCCSTLAAPWRHWHVTECSLGLAVTLMLCVHLVVMLPVVLPCSQSAALLLLINCSRLQGRNKRCITVDLHKPEGRDIIRR